MAESADDPELFWVDPRRRGILPLDAFHVPRRLRRVVRQGGFRDPLRQRLRGGHPRLRRGDREAAEHLDQRRDRAALCRALRPRRRAQRRVLARRRRWSAGSTASRSARAFFGESMFSRVTDASKVALVHLVARLRLGGYPPARHPVPDAASGALRRDRDQPRALSSAARRGAAYRGVFSGRPCRMRCRRATRSPLCSRARSRRRPGARAPTAPGSKRTSSR